MKYNFKEIGHDIIIYEPVTIIRPETISLASHILVSEFAYINGGLGTYIGNHIHIATQSCISGGGYFIMEDFAGMAAGAKVITGSALFNGEGLTTPTIPKEFQSVKRSFVIMKKHSIIATNVVVQPGVIIGEGTVVGSGSVVTKDLDPWSIYMGIPAVKVKNRNSENILRLEKEIYKFQKLKPIDFNNEINEILLAMREIPKF
jgi:acetyltransferase-like isoleucine patch superfamily enzyme